MDDLFGFLFWRFINCSRRSCLLTWASDRWLKFFSVHFQRQQSSSTWCVLQKLSFRYKIMLVLKILDTQNCLMSAWTGSCSWINLWRRGPGQCSNLVKNMLTRFFGATPGKLGPFENFQSTRNEEATTGWRYIDAGHKRSIENYIAWINLI